MAINKLPRSGIADSAVTSAKVGDGLINAANEFPDCQIASTRLADCAVTNAKLSNSAITIRGTSTALGASLTVNPDVNWQSVVVSDGSTVTTMVAGRGYFVNNASAAGLVKLPSSAAIGDTIKIKDYAANFGTNNLTIQRNSHNIQGVAADATVDTNRASLTAVYVDSTKGWVFTDESNVADLQSATYISATGGTVTTSSNDKIHTFTGDGNFVVSSVGNPAGGGGTVNYLVVAAGGGGGANSGGGSGAGGYRTNFPSPTTGGLSVTAQTYPITVGAGGVDGGNNPGDPIGTNGSNSVFSTITSTGGGYGGSPVHTFCGSRNGNGNTGGSGGGGGAGPPGGPVSVSGAAGNTPPVSPSQGNAGGNGSSGPNCGSTGGGGGGAGGAGDTGQTPGSAPFTNMGACGGVGSPNSISASAVYYSGGGGGTRQYTPGAGIAVPVGGSGGNGGGGNGGATQAPGNPGGVNVAAQAGTANTGGGGGGGSSNQAGGTGGSGIVIVRYKYQN